MSDFIEYAEYYKKAWESSLKERTAELYAEIKTLQAENARKCECDLSLGFFCAHCANENNYIQDLQNQIIALQDKLNKFQINLTVCKNDYWFMINLLERYSTDKEQAIEDCVSRMKFRKGIFNILEEE